MDTIIQNVGHIDQIITLAENLRQQPLAHLLPHSCQLQRLFTITKEINTAVNTAVVSRSAGTIPELCTTEPPQSSDKPRSVNAAVPHPAAAPQAKRSRQVSATRALQAASNIAPVLAEAIRAVVMTRPEEWFRNPSDPRAHHLQPILCLQNDKAHSSIDAMDRILLASSCRSLALDFARFEQGQGFTSKHQILLSQLMNGESLTVQRHGHQHGSFFAGLGDVGHHRGKFDVGLRLGTKMRIIQSCGEATGIGSTLGLLLAYEFRSLNRMSYREFSTLLALLQGPKQPLLSIINFSNEFDEWWLNFSDQYHAMHGEIIIRPRSTVIARPLTQGQSLGRYAMREKTVAQTLFPLVADNGRTCQSSVEIDDPGVSLFDPGLYQASLNAFESGRGSSLPSEHDGLSPMELMLGVDAAERAAPLRPWPADGMELWYRESP